MLGEVKRDRMSVGKEEKKGGCRKGDERKEGKKKRVGSVREEGRLQC